MNFLCIYLGEKGGGGCTNACICMGTHSQPFTTEPHNGCLRNLVGMKCSWSLTRYFVFRPDPSRGGSRAGPKVGHGGSLFLQRTSASDWKAIATNRMHKNDLEACGMLYCYFWFHSKVKFLTRFQHLFGLIVILPYFNAISVDFYAV